MQNFKYMIDRANIRIPYITTEIANIPNKSSSFISKQGIKQFSLVQISIFL